MTAFCKNSGVLEQKREERTSVDASRPREPFPLLNGILWKEEIQCYYYSDKYLCASVEKHESL